MPDPTCPHEDCTETVTHWHDVDGEVFICPRTEGRRCPFHVDPDFRCYAPRTQPTPLDAILAAADDAKRAHDRLCDLAETLVPAPQPPAVVRLPDGWERGHDAKYWVETGLTPYGLTLDEERAPGVLNWLGVDYYRPDSPHLPPQPIALPTVDEAAEAVVQSTRDEGWSYRTTAQAVLDLIAARITPWKPVAPGTVIKAGTRYRIEWDDASMGGASATERHSSFDFTPCPTDPGRYYIDPRTVPAEPDAALIADLRQYVTSATSDDELRDMIAAVRKADAARADQ